MSTQKPNPFVMPGMGQGAPDMASNPLAASMEMMRQAWESLSGPGGLTQAMPVNAALNLPDLERRLTELRSVESWLRMNLSMLSSTIQGMEVQRSTITTLRSFAESMAQPGGAAGFGPFGMPGAGAPSAPPASSARHQSEPQSPPDEPEAAGQDAGTAIPPAASAATQAWWDLLQNQFNQLAAATAQAMPGVAAGAAPPAASRSGASAGAAPAAGSRTGARAGAAQGNKTPEPKSPRKSAPRKSSARKSTP